MKTLLLKILAVAALSICAGLIPLATALFAVGKDDYWRPLVNIKQLFPQPRIEQCFELRDKHRQAMYRYRLNPQKYPCPYTTFELAKYICLNCSEYMNSHSSKDHYETIRYDCFGEPMYATPTWTGSLNVVWLDVQDTYQVDNRIAWIAAQSSPKLPSLAIFTEEYYERYNVYSKTYVKKNSYY